MNGSVCISGGQSVCSVLVSFTDILKSPEERVASQVVETMRSDEER